MDGVPRKLPAASVVLRASVNDRAQVALPQPLAANTAIFGPADTYSRPSAMLGVAVIVAPTVAVRSTAPVAALKARTPFVIGSCRTPPSSAGPMPLPAKPVAADHRGVHTWVPTEVEQFVLPVASNANTLPAPFANTLPPSATGGVAGPLVDPSGARNSGAQTLWSVVQLRVPSTSQPTS